MKLTIRIKLTNNNRLINILIANRLINILIANKLIQDLFSYLFYSYPIL